MQKKSKSLFCHDYGQGVIYCYFFARSADEVLRIFPELELMPSDPPLKWAPTQYSGQAMISNAMEKVLLNQLNREFSSAYLYLAMSAYCSHLEFNGAASWFKLQYEEATLGGIISKLKLVKDDGYGLLMIDSELGTRNTATSRP